MSLIWEIHFSSVQCCAGMSGYVHDFEVLGGKDGKGLSENAKLLYEFSESKNVVLHLTHELEKGKHKVFLSISLLVLNFWFS